MVTERKTLIQNMGINHTILTEFFPLSLALVDAIILNFVLNLKVLQNHGMFI